MKSLGVHRIVSIWAFLLTFGFSFTAIAKVEMGCKEGFIKFEVSGTPPGYVSGSRVKEGCTSKLKEEENELNYIKEEDWKGRLIQNGMKEEAPCFVYEAHKAGEECRGPGIPVFDENDILELKEKIREGQILEPDAQASGSGTA